VPNKSTIEKNLQIARQLAVKAGEKQKPLAKEVLEDFMHLTAGMAAFYQPTAPGQPSNPNQDETKFWQAALACKEFAKALAPYQSPTFKAIVGMPAMPSGAPEKPAGKQIEGKVIDITDVATLTRVYRSRIVSVRG
jgi:hypothetical protein